MSAALDKERAQRFGKYILIERLGRGGMAEVWKARISGPAGFQRTMVLKRILPHLVEDPQFVNMFTSEARLSARLNHANIVQVFELGDVDGEYYLAMEYVRGRDLVNVVRAQLHKGLPPPGLGATVLREVCRALAYAHQLTDERGQPLRLIHRDVSPSNVMIGFDGAVKLLDFGIAKALGETAENKTVTGTLKGKFGYMSPEQVDAKEIDHRADLFAAGIVLHEVLTGKRLFKGQTDLHTIAMVREAKVEAPSLSNPAVPPELDQICLKALARDPNDRWRGCDEMAAALDDVVHQLKWGTERLSVQLRELFPDEPSTTRNVPALAETGLQSAVTIGALRRHEWRWRVAVGVAGLAMVGGIVWLLSARAVRRTAGPAAQPGASSPTSPSSSPSSSPSPSPSPSRAWPGQTGAPPPPAAPAQPLPPSATVLVRVKTEPAGADVFLGNDAVARGQTPLELTLPRSNVTQQVLLRLKGYEPQTVDVTPDSDSRLQLTLNRAVARPAAAHGARHGGGGKRGDQAPAAAPAPPLPNLRNGDVVDPFAPSGR